MLTGTINQDTDAALKAGETERLGVLRLMRTSLKNEQIKVGHELSDDEAMGVLVREAKQRRDSIASYNQANRVDLAAVEAAELVIIETYLPKQLDETAIKELVEQAVTAAGDNPQMGAVIGAVRAKAGAAADGAVIARLVRERLGS